MPKRSKDPKGPGTSVAQRVPWSRRAWLRRAFVVTTLPIAALACGWLSVSLTAAGADPAPAVTVPAVTTPSTPIPPSVSTPTTAGSDASVNIDFGSVDSNGKKKPNQSIIIILLLTVLSIAPALMVMLTSFTRIVIVLSLTRNALGLPSIPPNQVVVGLAMFLSLFVMGPTFTKINDVALQPLLAGKIDYSQAYDRAQVPLKTFMLDQTRRGELNLFINASGQKPPKNRTQVPLTTLIPAFILSELKTAFIIGFVIFIPFLIIDLVVSASLMSMGMVMVQPMTVALPFKILLFILVDGWGLIITTLVNSYRGG